MISNCLRQNRCARITCERCARRYSAQIARRVLGAASGSLAATEIHTNCAPSDFHSWRIAVRNLVDHQRRQSRWWRRFALHVWLSADGEVRGICTLGDLTVEEVRSDFVARKPTNLRPLDKADLRNAVYAAVAPSVIAPVNGYGRYQSIKLSVGPRRTHPCPSPSSAAQQDRFLEAMPIIL